MLDAKIIIFFLDDVLCLPCDHHLYSQVGCGGKCTKNNYAQERLVYCEEEGCKPGYYYIGGICHPCSFGSPHCTNCTFLPPEGKLPSETTERIYKCLGCESIKYRVESDGKRHECYISGYEFCHLKIIEQFVINVLKGII